MRFPKMPTLSDVAERAKVSKMTASVVLNGARSGTKVSQETRRRIIAVAEEMGYRPNAVAQSLARQRTRIVGLYNGLGPIDATAPFLAHIISGLQHGCERHELDLLLHRTFRGRSAERIYGELANGQVDGLILLASVQDLLAERLSTADLPVVALGNAVPGLASVTVDDRGGARLQAEYLAQRGHRFVLYLRAHLNHASLEERHAAFLEAAQELGIEVLDLLQASDECPLPQEALKLLAGADRHRPTAIVCWADHSAHGALLQCIAANLRVPDQVAVLGFDGLAARVEPGWILTTIRAPWRCAAEEALECLVRRIHGEEVGSRTILPVELIQGNTA